MKNLEKCPKSKDGKHECTILHPVPKNESILICKHCKKYGVDVRMEKGIKAEYLLNSAGQIIYSIDNKGYETWTKYNRSGRKLKYATADGYSDTYQYDTRGHLIHRKESFLRPTGEIVHQEFLQENDNKGRPIYRKILTGLHSGLELWFAYRKNMELCVMSDGRGYVKEVDDQGREVYYNDFEGHERRTKYDKDGREIQL